MKTWARLLIASSAIGFWFALPAAAQSVSVEMLDHYSQTSAAAPTETATPFSFEIHLRANGAVSMANWGPAYTLPGSVTPPSGAAGNTNTGTRNFSASPNAGLDYFFQANYATAGAMTAVYPNNDAVNPYTIHFNGTTPPVPASLSSGLTFTAGGYANVAPQVTGLDNGAAWSAGLAVSTTGTTNLTLNSGSFTGYTTSSIGAEIQWRLSDQSGTAILGGGTKYAPSFGFTDSVLSAIAITGSSLTAGQSYTLAIQYGIFAGTPGTTSLSGTTFTAYPEYFMNTSIALTAIPEPSTDALMLAFAALGLAVIQRKRARA